MATVVELVLRGELDRFDPVLRSRQQAARLLYGRQRVWEWIEKNLPDAVSEHGSLISPLEELDELLNAFCAGDELSFDRQIKPLQHWGHGIWELKTKELRIFGWFSSVDVFIACSIDFATRIKAHRLYAGYRDEAVRFRDTLDLTPPKFITGDDPRGVATNIGFA